MVVILRLGVVVALSLIVSPANGQQNWISLTLAPSGGQLTCRLTCANSGAYVYCLDSDPCPPDPPNPDPVPEFASHVDCTLGSAFSHVRVPRDSHCFTDARAESTCGYQYSELSLGRPIHEHRCGVDDTIVIRHTSPSLHAGWAIAEADYLWTKNQPSDTLVFEVEAYFGGLSWGYSQNGSGTGGECQSRLGPNDPDCPGDPNGPSPPISDVLTREGLVVYGAGGIVVGTFRTYGNCCQVAHGVSPAADGSVVFSVPGSEGVSRVATATIRFTDAQLDVDGDGRFNDSDVTALAAYYGSTDPNSLARWNFRDSEEPNDPVAKISMEDAEIMGDLIGYGLGSGVFGDVDGSMQLDCGDAFVRLDYLSETLPDANYLIVLDHDLDGIIAAWELDLAHRAIFAGDADGDWDVDLDDYLLINGAIGATPGQPGYSVLKDASNNQVVDLDDLLIALAKFETTCP